MKNWTEHFNACIMKHANPIDIKGCQIAFKRHQVYMDPSEKQKHVKAYGKCVRKTDECECSVQFSVSIPKRPPANQDAVLIVE